MKAYNHLVGYLHRWTLFKWSKLHVRLHHILSTDGTPFLHSHPFDYASFVFRGGYTEQVLVGNELVEVQHVAPAIIFRRGSTFHRIVDVKENCKTLFFAYGEGTWELKRHPKIKSDWDYKQPFEERVYLREINGEWYYNKFENGVWYAGADTADEAMQSTKLSVHQCGKWESFEQ